MDGSGWSVVVSVTFRSDYSSDFTGVPDREVLESKAAKQGFSGCRAGFSKLCAVTRKSQCKAGYSHHSPFGGHRKASGYIGQPLQSLIGRPCISFVVPLFQRIVFFSLPFDGASSEFSMPHFSFSIMAWTTVMVD